MRKCFKAKRKFKFKFVFWIFLFFITIIVNIFGLDNFSKAQLMYGNSNLLKFDFDKKKILLKIGLNFKEKVVDQEIPTFNEIDELDQKRKIFLYNTHQTEKYLDTDILEMSRLFKDKLMNSGFDVYLDETNISDIVDERGLKYKDSYKITRELVMNALDDEYDLYIDLHRDSSKKKVTTISINDKNYAKVMFVIGSNHDDYQNNYNLVDSLNRYVKNINNKLSRGIYVRDSSIYNQDLDSNVILIELGGVDNTREEVNNSLDMLVEVFKNYFQE